MAEASSIVEEALRDLAVIAQGETPSTEDAVFGAEPSQYHDQ